LRLGRHRSTIYRELSRNGEGLHNVYDPRSAVVRAATRRKSCNQARGFSTEQLAVVDQLIREQWSPEQVSGYLARRENFWISHETIYRHIWRNKRVGGDLHTHLRSSKRKRRKRYGSYRNRSQLPDRRNIAQRPAYVERRQSIGHWEIDTVCGSGSRDCIVTLVERKSGYVLIGKMRDKTPAELNRATICLASVQSELFKTITSDNGTEFAAFKHIEDAVRLKFYFANPHHAWERGTNENTNGLIRQYLPKRTSMSTLTQAQCNRIANTLNDRPRKRHGFKTPVEVLYASR
jgi:IS30 family transposase